MTALTHPAAQLPGPAAGRRARLLTLMRREWLQHRIGWCVLWIAPSALMLLLTLVDNSLVQVKLDGENFMAVGLHKAPPVMQVLLLGLGLTAATLVLALLTLGFQLPGLARRDVQDRSIEFWRSMPTSHLQSLAATLLMHLLALPWAAIAAGLLGSQLVALFIVTSAHGVGAWLSLPWASIVPAGLAVGLRLAWGLLLAVLWLSPVILLTMAASAWLKRWGVPVLVASVLAGLNLLDARLQQPLVKLTLDRLLQEAGLALMHRSPLHGAHIAAPEHVVSWLPDLPAWALADAVASLQRLASQGFMLAIAVAAGAFALLVWRRRAG